MSVTNGLGSIMFQRNFTDCQDLLKTRSEELALKSYLWTQLSLHLTLLNMHLKEFSFKVENWWEY